MSYSGILPSQVSIRLLRIPSRPGISRCVCPESMLTGLKVSQRGVVFFRAQDNLTNDLQKKLILRLGELVGRPATSGLHIHPVLNSERELGGNDPEISTISSVQHNKYYAKTAEDGLSTKNQTSAQWHSDIAFEPVPADYTSLRLVQLPKTGGGKTPPPTHTVTSHSLWQSLTHTSLRHPLGLRLRNLRPHQRALPEVSGEPNRHLRAAGLQQGRRAGRLQALRQGARRPGEQGHRAESHPPRRPHQPRHRLEEHLPRRRPRQAHQRPDGRREPEAVVVVFGSGV